MVPYKYNKCINKNNRVFPCSHVRARVRQMCGAARCPKTTRNTGAASARTAGNLSKKGRKKEADKRRKCGPWFVLARHFTLHLLYAETGAVPACALHPSSSLPPRDDAAARLQSVFALDYAAAVGELRLSPPRT